MVSMMDTALVLTEPTIGRRGVQVDRDQQSHRKTVKVFMKTKSFLKTGTAYLGCSWYLRMQHKAGHRVNMFGRRKRGRGREEGRGEGRNKRRAGGRKIKRL